MPKTGAIAFAAIPVSAGSIENTVTKLREALEPHVAMVSDIPPFDVALAHELYTQILKPVEAGWRPAKNLIVATNGALGLLPLGLLPTAQPFPFSHPVPCMISSAAWCASSRRRYFVLTASLP